MPAEEPDPILAQSDEKPGRQLGHFGKLVRALPWLSLSATIFAAVASITSLVVASQSYAREVPRFDYTMGEELRISHTGGRPHDERDLRTIRVERCSWKSSPGGVTDFDVPIDRLFKLHRIDSAAYVTGELKRSIELTDCGQKGRRDITRGGVTTTESTVTVLFQHNGRWMEIDWPLGNMARDVQETIRRSREEELQ